MLKFATRNLFVLDRPFLSFITSSGVKTEKLYNNRKQFSNSKIFKEKQSPSREYNYIRSQFIGNIIHSI